MNFSDKAQLKQYFQSIKNPFEALQIKQNIEEAMQFLTVPSPELLEMLKKEGFDPAVLTQSKTEKIQKPKAERKINIETRSFLIEHDQPVKILHGRAVKSAIENGQVVLKYDELNHSQQVAAKTLM